MVNMAAWELCHAGRRTIKDRAVQRSTNKASNDLQGGRFRMLNLTQEPCHSGLEDIVDVGVHRVRRRGVLDLGKLSWGGEQWAEGRVTGQGDVTRTRSLASQ